MSAVSRLNVVSARSRSANTWQQPGGTIARSAISVPRASSSFSTSSASAFNPFNGLVRSGACGASQGIIPGFASGALKRVAPVGRRALNVQAVAAPAQMTTEEYATKYGFEVLKTEFIPEYNSNATLFRHKKTNAEVMSLANDDENKTFGAVFRTPPKNSTGIPHILEHSVLCGSRKYPIKEPFVELMKGSLNTFLNAFTYPDRTCYPVASCNTQDFYNLVDVYLDAVLYPNCIRDKQTFEQEGWHHELEDPKEEVTFKGVVFNEMKGVYSSPESVLGREIQQQLFPDNTYGVDSGGDPVSIPDLTYEEFKEFHALYYHPSNGRFWFYGDDEPSERLRILDAYLNDFEKVEPNSEIGKQKLFTAPKYVVEKYASSDTSEEEPKTFLAVNWLLSEDRFDLQTEFGFSFLNFLMLGTSASPLRKALEESGLGEALVGGGLEDELRQPTFSIGLKGVKAEDVAAVEALVMSTLKALAKDGFDKEAIEAAVNTIEFSLRENNTGRFPRGLSLMLRSMSSWLYEGDAFEPMKYAEALAAFKERMAKEDVFGPLIEELLIKNPHRVTIELQPDATLGKKMEQSEKDKLTSFKKSLNEEEVNALIESTKSLKLKQETTDDAEALKCVPSLALADIPRTCLPIPCALETTSDGTTFLRHDIFTNDVLYVEAAFPMNTVPTELLPLVPLFCRCLTSMGTDKLSFVEMTQKMGRKTGGISVYPLVSDLKGSTEPVSYIMVKGKTMADKTEDMMELFAEILKDIDFNDKPRFRQMVLETKAGMESQIVGGGHSVAASRLDAMNSAAGWVNEQMGGISYLDFTRELVKRVEDDWEGIVKDLQAIRTAVISRRGTVLNVTAEEKLLTAVDPSLNSFLASLPATGGQPQQWTQVMEGCNEGLVVPTQVNYVGKAGNLYNAGYELSGSAYVISKYLGTSWLWDRVRVSGGAYGGFCDFDSHSGMFTYLSYRDPNLLATVDNYDGTGDFLRGLKMDKDAMDKAIIGCIGDIDSYQLPDSKGYTSMMRHLMQIKEEDRQFRRDQILSTTIKDFQEFAEVLEEVKMNGNVVAVASADAVKRANEKRNGLLTVKNIL